MTRSFSHVVIVVMENHGFDQVIGNPDAPYLNALARQGALATGYRGVAHPSLPNYLALLGGDTFGIASDCTACHVAGASLVDQMEGAGISWKAYMEGISSPCFTGPSAGRYAKKHDPFVYFDRVVANAAWCGKVVPLGRLAVDLRAGALPRFAWITPDLCHDMHDCSVGEGDRFLAGLLPPVLGALGPDGVLFVTWDEAEVLSNRVALIVAGPSARTGARSSEILTHYSLLRTVEEGLGLTLLRNAADAPPIDPLLWAP